MKTVEQLKGEIFSEVQNSGFLKNVQSQVKAHVLDLVEQQTHGNKEKLGFKYEHPVLKKLRAYPLTALCMDLIQEFLQSFKFKHTLNVFKKEINRDMKMNRNNLSKQFSIDLSGKDQAVLLSIVSQLFNGDIKIIEKTEKQRQRQQQQISLPRRNNFMNQESLNNTKNQRQGAEAKPAEKNKKEPFYYDLAPKQAEPKPQEKSIAEDKNKANGIDKFEVPKQPAKKQKEKQKINEVAQEQKQPEEELDPKAAKKKKKEEEKPPQQAEDLLKDVMEKFKVPIKNKSKEEEELYQQKRAFSEEKKKQIKKEEGVNKIRGVSMGKMGNLGSGGSINSFMKFSSFNQQATKNQSQIDEQLDEFQQSTSSLRKNPLYSSSESGFDKSYGYDQSVDSMAIQDFEYVEKAKKFGKKY